MRTTSSLRPLASVAASSVARNGVQRFRVWIFRSGRRLADDAARRDEARDVVDMAVGVVVLQALVDPDDFPGSESLGQRLLGGGFRPAVAIGIQQRLPRRQDRALAIVIDGAAFEHEIEAADRRCGKARNVVADRRVIGQIVLAAPAVGFEAQRHGALVTTREDGAGIAQPDVAVLCRNDFGRVANGRASRGFGLVAVRKQPHVVARRVQRSDKRRHVAARRFKIAVPLCRGLPARPSRSPFAAPIRRER